MDPSLLASSMLLMLTKILVCPGTCDFTNFNKLDRGGLISSSDISFLKIYLVSFCRNYLENGSLNKGWLFSRTEEYFRFCQQTSFKNFDYTS